jgi:hypothetical protein
MRWCIALLAEIANATHYGSLAKLRFSLAEFSDINRWADETAIDRDQCESKGIRDD